MFRRLLVRLLRWLTDEPEKQKQAVAHRLKPHPDTELVAQNNWLRRAVIERDKEIATLNRLLAIARREGKAEAFDECYYQAIRHGQEELADAIAHYRGNLR